MKNEYFNAVQYLEKPYMVIKAYSGGIRFSIPVTEHPYRLHLLTKECPHKKVISIELNECSRLVERHRPKNIIKFTIRDFYNEPSYDFWLTWFNNVICVGKFKGPDLLRYPVVNRNYDEMIGFVKFNSYNNITNWDVVASPFIYPSLAQPKKVDGGDLRWVKMTKGDMLPVDALIGGFEFEPLYIARAEHNGSLCPGKYLRSKQLAFIPWGQRAFPKKEFEILCGYDALWVKASKGMIPENAFIGGYSEIGDEPLYIGRAWVNNNLIIGKVPVKFHTCYLPIDNKEIENNQYETLVIGNKVCRGERSDICYMKMDMQPCL